jgi:hypothetical protein
MQGRSPQFDATVRKSHRAVPRVDIIQDAKVVDQLAVHSGSVTADRTAAQMRSFEIEVSDPNGTLTPDGMTSTLAPFGTRMQLWRGVRISNVEIESAFYNDAGSWVPSGASTGTLASVKVDTDGSITLGP